MSATPIAVMLLVTPILASYRCVFDVALFRDFSGDFWIGFVAIGGQFLRGQKHAKGVASDRRFFFLCPVLCPVDFRWICQVDLCLQQFGSLPQLVDCEAGIAANSRNEVPKALVRTLIDFRSPLPVRMTAKSDAVADRFQR